MGDIKGIKGAFKNRGFCGPTFDSFDLPAARQVVWILSGAEG